MGQESELKQRINFSVVHVTDRCNFSCEHCLEKRGPNDMSPAGFAQVLNWLNNPSLQSVVVYGGEVRIHPHFKEIVTLAKQNGLRVEVFTNGFGMSSPAKTVEIINELSEIGVDELTISTDKDHRDYAEKMGITIDYEFLKSLFNLMTWEKRKEEVGIMGNIIVNGSGNDRYAIPVGRAKNFSWERRLESGWGYDPKLIKKIHGGLENEYVDWSNVKSYSHSCYCYPAKLVRESKKTFEQGSDAYWVPHINTDMTVTACPFDVIPRVGSVPSQTSEEIFHTITSNFLYYLIANEGPQGVARIVWDIPESELRERFMERTPCGLCEDLAATNFSDLQGMANTVR